MSSSDKINLSLSVFSQLQKNTLTSKNDGSINVNEEVILCCQTFTVQSVILNRLDNSMDSLRIKMSICPSICANTDCVHKRIDSPALPSSVNLLTPVLVPVDVRMGGVYLTHSSRRFLVTVLTAGRC